MQIQTHWHPRGEEPRLTHPQHIGDTKAGTLIGIDRFGNKYFENNSELPLRTRWVDFKQYEWDPYVPSLPLPSFPLPSPSRTQADPTSAHIEPGWHAWISYQVDAPPTQDKLLRTGVRAWELPTHRPNPTFSRGAYKTYSTVKGKIEAWEPTTAAR